jgi:lactoylglutathione lyase
MHIDHIAIWTCDLENLREFYSKYFGCKASAKYHNPLTNFSSYFLSFESGARIEIMQRSGIPDWPKEQRTGLAHFAILVGTTEEVDLLTSRLEKDGIKVAGYPRVTGDGYYESVVLDPDNNKIELTARK